MSQPKVTITELDGAVGILPPTAGRLLAIVGASSSGTANAPATYARVRDVQTAFGYGPLVEAAAFYIEKYGKPVVLVKTAASVAAAVSAVTSVGTGSSVVTVTAVPTPNDDYELYLKFTTGGTRGTGGAYFQWSLDGGRTLSPITALGTAISFAFPNGGGVGFDFGAGTFVAGDVHTARATAAQWNSSEIGAALDALFGSVVNWELAEVVGAIDATTFDTIDGKFSGAVASGKYRAWIGGCRIPTIGESDATYLSSVSGVFAAKASVFGVLCAGACKLTSGVSGRKYKRPIAHLIAAREASLSEEQNSAAINLGALPGVSIRDSNGNADEHDESLSPGLDDARFTVLRTHDGVQGVYVNIPRIFSAAGSDFRLLPHRRVLNIAHGALRQYFIRRLNQPVLVDKATGYILEEDALEIEAGANAALRTVLLEKPKASSAIFVLSRTDNLLSTQTMTGEARVVPLAYPETINLSVGFTNPALQTVAAA